MVSGTNCPLGKCSASFINLVWGSKVVKLFLNVPKSANDHIRAEVKGSRPGNFVVCRLLHAARDSNFIVG